MVDISVTAHQSRMAFITTCILMAGKCPDFNYFIFNSVLAGFLHGHQSTYDWLIKGLGMSSLVYATGHIKDPVPLIAKRRGLSPGGRFPPSFIHQVIITGLNKLYNCMFSP